MGGGRPVLDDFRGGFCSSNDKCSLWQQHQSQVSPLSLPECCSYHLCLCSLRQPLCVSSTTCSLIKMKKACRAELRPRPHWLFFSLFDQRGL